MMYPYFFLNNNMSFMNRVIIVGTLYDIIYVGTYVSYLKALVLYF